MRTVSFVEHLEFECQGNVFSKAVTVGDVDNDQSNELVVGNIHGDLHIHKGSDPKPWRKCADLGTITCVEVGDVCNHGYNYLVTCSVEGWCHLFAVKPDSPPTATLQENHGENDDSCRLLKPVHRQHLAANSKVIVIADIDDDGHLELVIGYSDRRVRSYRWLDAGNDSATGMHNGNFLLIENWQLAGQLSSMTVHKRHDSSLDLMVSQPGGAFVTLLDSIKGKVSEPERPIEMKLPPKGNSSQVKPESSPNKNSFTQGPTLVYHPLGTARARNPGVTTEVAGNISRRKKGEETYVPSYCAICTLDGTLTLLDDDKILWSLYVGHQLFTLTKLDVTGDGTEEVVACSADGHTYIVNLNRDVVRFHFDEDVAAFCAGSYSVTGNENVPCLIYVTFNNRVVVYYNIELRQIGSTNLTEVMDSKPEKQELLNFFNCDVSRPTQVRQLFHWCLYGKHPKQHETM